MAAEHQRRAESAQAMNPFALRPTSSDDDDSDSDDDDSDERPEPGGCCANGGGARNGDALRAKRSRRAVANGGSGGTDYSKKSLESGYRVGKQMATDVRDKQRAAAKALNDGIPTNDYIATVHSRKYLILNVVDHVMLHDIHMALSYQTGNEISFMHIQSQNRAAPPP